MESPQSLDSLDSLHKLDALDALDVLAWLAWLALKASAATYALYTAGVSPRFGTHAGLACWYSASLACLKSCVDCTNCIL